MLVTSPSLLIMIFFLFFFSTLGIQALFGVQLLMDFYMKNKYKNIKSSNKQTKNCDGMVFATLTKLLQN